MKAHRFARSMFIDHEAGEILIDGETFPWYVAEAGPTVTHDVEWGYSTVELPVLIDGHDVTVLHTYEQDLDWIRAEGKRQKEEALAAFRLSCGIQAGEPVHRTPVHSLFARLADAVKGISRAVKPKPHQWEFTRAH